MKVGKETSATDRKPSIIASAYNNCSIVYALPLNSIDKNIVYVNFVLLVYIMFMDMPSTWSLDVSYVYNNIHT